MIIGFANHREYDAEGDKRVADDLHPVVPSVDDRVHAANAGDTSDLRVALVACRPPRTSGAEARREPAVASFPTRHRPRRSEEDVALDGSLVDDGLGRDGEAADAGWMSGMSGSARSRGDVRGVEDGCCPGDLELDGLVGVGDVGVEGEGFVVLRGG